MRCKRAVIDSLNLISPKIEELFQDRAHYNIEPVKTIAVFTPQRWKEEFGKPLTRNIVEAQILHTDTGLILPLKRYAARPDRTVIEFAGIYAYNERSRLLIGLLERLESRLRDCIVSRIDVAIDFKGKVPLKVYKTLSRSGRKPFAYKSTTYYKTQKEKKSNSRLNIKIYDKGRKEKLNRELYRLEFVFQGSYFQGLTLKELESYYPKMQKTIKNFTGVDVCIMSPF